MEMVLAALTSWRKWICSQRQPLTSFIQRIVSKTGESMSTKFLSTLAGAVMLSAALNLHATTPATQNMLANSADAPLVRLGGGEVATLQQDYEILATADHDYKGHRVHAMKAIAAACKLLGTDITGGGKVREQQALSDEQLRQVLASIEQVRGSLAAAGAQPQVVKHLDTAINQLTIALSIK
jgi:hypothetical protein